MWIAALWIMPSIPLFSRFSTTRSLHLLSVSLAAQCNVVADIEAPTKLEEVAFSLEVPSPNVPLRDSLNKRNSGWLALDSTFDPINAVSMSRLLDRKNSKTPSLYKAFATTLSKHALANLIQQASSPHLRVDIDPIEEKQETCNHEGGDEDEVAHWPFWQRWQNQSGAALPFSDAFSIDPDVESLQLGYLFLRSHIPIKPRGRHHFEASHQNSGRLSIESERIVWQMPRYASNPQGWYHTPQERLYFFVFDADDLKLTRDVPLLAAVGVATLKSGESRIYFRILGSIAYCPTLQLQDKNTGDNERLVYCVSWKGGHPSKSGSWITEVARLPIGLNKPKDLQLLDAVKAWMASTAAIPQKMPRIPQQAPSEETVSE